MSVWNTKYKCYPDINLRYSTRNHIRHEWTDAQRAIMAFFILLMPQRALYLFSKSNYIVLLHTIASTIRRYSWILRMLENLTFHQNMRAKGIWVKIFGCTSNKYILNKCQCFITTLCNNLANAFSYYLLYITTCENK